MNDLTVTQISQILNTIMTNVTGTQAPVAVNTSEFVAQATTVLKQGYDPVINAISQIMHKTIFSSRSYSPIFAGIRRDSQQWGNHVRKLNPLDETFEDNDAYSLTDNTSLDQYVIRKPQVVQTNFYGETTYAKHLTIFDYQINTAFKGPDQLGEFFSMVMTNASNQIAQAHEELERSTVANFIAGKSLADSGNVIAVLSAYNAATGLNLTATTVKQPNNYPAFAKWLFAYIKTLAMNMRTRSYRYHLNFTDQNIPRFSRPEDLIFYMYAPEMNNIDTSVMSGVFQTDYMKLMTYRPIAYWQDLEAPMDITVTPGYTNASGVATTGAETTVDNILGILFDREAIGWTTVEEKSIPTPYNARGDYYNQYWKWVDRYWNDLTENAIVLLLE